MNTKVYNLPAKCSIKSIALRETNGIDEMQAKLAAEGSGTTEEHELCMLAIVEVNGEPVVPGLTGYRKWPTKTRQVVMRMHKSINGYNMSVLVELIRDAEDEGTELVNSLSQTKYKFPPGFDLEWVVLQEMMEADEQAVASAAPKDMEDEIIRRCIVRTNLGDKMSLESIRDLRTQTRAVLEVYWNGMNFIDDDEIAPLVKAAEVAAAERASEDSTESDSSVNGSGSLMEVGAA